MSVTRVLGKGFDSILNSLLTVRNTILEKSDPLQFGFKANCRTMDNKFMLNRIISKQKPERNLRMFALLISQKYLITLIEMPFIIN